MAEINKVREVTEQQQAVIESALERRNGHSLVRCQVLRSNT